MLNKKNQKQGGLTMYRTDDFRGNAQDSITLTNEVGGDSLFEKIKDAVISNLEERGIDAKWYVSEVKSGGLFGTRLPILVISNSQPENRYFDIGIFCNGNTVNFPLLGESAENTKANKKQYYEENGSYIKAALVKPDEMKLQMEIQWETEVLDCFNSLLA